MCFSYLFCEASGGEFGVQIAGYNVRVAVGKTLEVFGGFRKEDLGFDVFDVAYVLADEGFVTEEDAAGVVEFAT